MVWFYKNYAPEHSDFISKYLKTVELRQMIRLKFSKNKMVSTFAFDLIKFRRQLEELKPPKGLLQISKGIDWKYDTAMSNLNDIVILGRELGSYILIGMQADPDSLPMAVCNQLNMRINMGVPTPEIEKMVFPDNEKQLRPLSSHLKGWGFIKIGDSQIRSFFAPEVPKDFNLHKYMRSNIAKYQVKRNKK